MKIDLSKLSSKGSLRIDQAEANKFVIVALLPKNKYYKFLNNSLVPVEQINQAERFNTEKLAKIAMANFLSKHKADVYIERLKEFLKKIYTINFKYYPDDPNNYIIERYISHNLSLKEKEVETIEAVKDLALKTVKEYLTYCQGEIVTYKGRHARATNTLTSLDPDSIKVVKDILSAGTRKLNFDE
jgi:hypothetical protein